MALITKVLDLTFDGGLDTEANAKTTLAGSFRDLNNARFRERVTLIKRNGNRLIPTARVGQVYSAVSGCIGLASRNDGTDLTFLASSDELFSYVDGAGWRRAGDWTLLHQDTLSVPRGPNEAWDATTCSTGNLRYVFWQDARGGIFGRTLHLDPTDNTVKSLTPEYRVGGDRGYYPRAIVNGGRPQVCFISGTTLNVGVLNAGDPSSTDSQLSQLSNELPAGLQTSGSAFLNPYDVVAVPDQPLALVAYAALGGIKMGLMDPLGNMSAGGQPTVWVAQTASFGPALALSPGHAGQVAVVYSSGSAGPPVYQLFGATTFVRTLAATSLDPDTDVTGSGVRRLTAAWDPLNVLRFNVAVEVSSSRVGTTPDDPTLRRIKAYSVDLGPLTATSASMRHTVLASKAFSMGNHGFVWGHTPYADQSTDFLLRLPDLEVVARSRYSVAYPDVSGALSDVDVIVGPDGNDVAFRPATTRDNLSIPQTSSSVFQGRHVELLRTEYQPPYGFRPTDVDGVLHLNGGWPGRYDGDTVTEAGFALLVEGLSASLGSGSAPAGGGILNARDTLQNSGPPASASFVYEVLPYAYDARGNIEWGGGDDISVVLTASLTQVQNTASLSWHSLAHTVRDGTRAPNLAFAVYRTSFANGLPGTTRQRVDDPTRPIVNNTGSDLITFVDTFSNAFQQAGQVSYTNFEDVNVMPPAYKSSAAAGDRLYLMGLEGADDTVAVSKVRAGGPVAFTDAGTFTVDSEGGPLRHIAPLDGGISLFKRTRVYTAVADGPSNLSSDTTPWPLPQRVTSDLGVQDHPISVTVAGEAVQGTMFKSDRGIRILDRGGVLQNDGWPVARFNDLTVVAAVSHRDREEVRFYTAEGTTQVLDTRFNKWATDPNQPVAAACLWNGQPTFALADGRTWTEEPTRYRDDGLDYPLALTTEWFRFDGIQGYGQFLSILLIGDLKSHCRIRVEFAYDFRESWVVARTVDTRNLGGQPYGSGSYGSGGYGGVDPVLQFEVLNPFPRCQAFSLRITDLDQDPDGSGQGFSLTAGRVTLGIDTAGPKMPARKRR